MMAALQDAEPLALPQPDSIERVWIDTQNGLRADSGCKDAVELPFAQGSAPEERSPCMGTAPAPVRTIRNFLDRLFNRRD
jgi:penicillin-binding protein 1B